MASVAEPFDVYACAVCGQRSLTLTWPSACASCGNERRRIGLGGACPHCGEPVAVIELINQLADPE